MTTTTLTHAEAIYAASVARREALKVARTAADRKRACDAYTRACWDARKSHEAAK
jgi:hypothetical protein